MGRYERRLWKPDPGAPGGRANRAPFHYEAYVPDEIASSDLSMSARVAGAVSEADQMVRRLNENPPTLANLEALGWQLLRAESVASSRIEGLELSHKRLARAEYEEEASRDATAQSILGNIRAMKQAVELGASASELTVEDLLRLHATLLSATRDTHFAGQVRDRQNWIGGSSASPRNAEFIPPPHEFVPGLLADLMRFLNREDLSATLQAAVAHAQFETIHPFADGNGRVGRCLIHMVLRRRGLAPRYVPPISLVLATNADDYVRGLTDFRSDRVPEWVVLFADTTITAATEAERFACEIALLQERWRERAGNPRRDSAASKLIERLPAQPIVDAPTAERLIGASNEAVRLALLSLERAGVIKQTTLRKRNRVWEAAELYDLINRFERDLATPSGRKRPVRPAPYRA